jgi:hypothetical protein
VEVNNPPSKITILCEKCGKLKVRNGEALKSCRLGLITQKRAEELALEAHKRHEHTDYDWQREHLELIFRTGLNMPKDLAKKKAREEARKMLKESC